MKVSLLIDFTSLQAAIGGKFSADATIADIVNAAVPYVFTFAGLLLLIYLIYGGYGLMTSGGDPKKTAAAREKITYALVGFLVVFTAFWVTQILARILGLEPVINVFG